MPEVTVSRITLFAGAVAAIALVLALLRPWNLLSYRIEYLREEAVELAQAIDSRSPARLRSGWRSEPMDVLLIVSKPREEPLRLVVTYSRLVVPSPVPVERVVKGRPERAFERLRQTAVYFNSTHLVVDPKPVVEYSKSSEYGRTVHVVKLTLFVVRGDLRPGATLRYNSSLTTIYERTYDYSGTSRVVINGQKALEFQVSRDDELKVVVVRECWLAG